MAKKVKSNLHEIINGKGIKKKWLADQMGATASQINRWCNNKNGVAESTPSVYYVLQLEKLLDTPVKKMFELTEEE